MVTDWERVRRSRILGDSSGIERKKNRENGQQGGLMKVPITLLLSLPFVLHAAIPAQAQDAWYKNEPMRCESVAPAYMIEGFNAIFPRKLPVTGESNLGKLYLEWPTADYKQIQSSQNHSRLRMSHTLTKTEAQSFKTSFTKLGNEGVPWYANAAASTAAWMIPEPVTKLIFKGSWTLFSALVKNNASKIQALQLAVLFADGGELREIVIGDEASADRPYLDDSVVYQVKVGNEVRNYTILSCTYAVHLQ
jgi:hypothetical protein